MSQENIDKLNKGPKGTGFQTSNLNSTMQEKKESPKPNHQTENPNSTPDNGEPESPIQVRERLEKEVQLYSCYLTNNRRDAKIKELEDMLHKKGSTPEVVKNSSCCAIF
jgi:hypothetical protein